MKRISALSADVIAIAAFALFARIAHQTDDMPLNVVGWLSTLWPFLLGLALSWVVIAAAQWDGMKVMPAGVTAWLITVVVGLGIWGARNGEFPHWSFILVATVSSGLLMLGWRAVARVRTRGRAGSRG